MTRYFDLRPPTGDVWGVKNLTRRQYFDACMKHPTAWLMYCADNPTEWMRPRHVALIRLAIRHKLGGK